MILLIVLFVFIIALIKLDDYRENKARWNIESRIVEAKRRFLLNRSETFIKELDIEFNRNLTKQNKPL